MESSSPTHDYLYDAGQADGMAFEEAYYGTTTLADTQTYESAHSPMSNSPLFPASGPFPWLDGSSNDIYSQEATAATWVGGQASSPLAPGVFTGVDLESYGSWTPEGFSQDQGVSTLAPMALNQLQGAYSWPMGSSFDVNPLTASGPLVLQDMSYPVPDGSNHGMSYPEPLGIEDQSKQWLDPATYVPPQAIFQAPPPAESIASSPSSAMSSGVSALDFTDFSTSSADPTSAQSPSDPAASPASSAAYSHSSSLPASSPPLVRSCARAKGKGKPPCTKGRSSKTRRRLPSVTQEFASLSSARVTRARRAVHLSSAKQRRGSAKLHQQGDEAGVPVGAPYLKIDDMDPVSRQILDSTLLTDRHPCRPKQVPYSVIMAKLRHIFGGAEETLRGHHRRLTKPKEQRVRRPVWQSKDIMLLQQAVERCRRESSTGKISWTSVSEYIHNNGGSYKFGITTCSRKWRSLQG
ncbi:hypothetical protein HIM_05676 [Hirsutella minnesotensis 3608]|uniref:Myb-like domain-containing protein n=1 Tax=Hirsutella minnesotensis 3608 TaxID=1043627 RepID=A0A0F7ZP62_9HYPO|nr:hypothetical protein HIM_05676 [Hirsutella minnesotensis 3608]